MIHEYTKRLTNHILQVRLAGRKLGVSEKQLIDHDLSKWEEPEFTSYAEYYCGDRTKEVNERYAVAWLHHIHNNKHHWQYWMFSDQWNFSDGDVINGVVRMPESFVLEMVADWLGASKAYTGSWDMTEWLDTNLDRITLHKDSRAYLDSVLESLGYEGKE